MVSPSVSVTFWQVVDELGRPIEDDLEWGAWLDHISGLTVEQRKLNVAGRDRLGMVWSPEAAGERMLILGADRQVNPSTTNYTTGAIEPAVPPPGSAYAERVSGILMPGNVLAAVSLGTAALNRTGLPGGSRP